LAVGAVLAGLAGGSARAADDGAAELSGVEVLAHPAHYDAERTQSATRTDTPLIDVPQAVSVVTRQQIRDQDLQGMADLVRYVPGVSWSLGEGNRDTPVLRGQASTADFFVDGVRDDVQYIRDLYNAERVEVLKGPNAMIFGRGGGGGVINRVSKTAEGSGLRELVLEGGAYGQARGVLDVDQSLSPSLAGRLAAMDERSGSYRDRVNLERWGLNPTLAWRAAPELRLDAGYERFHDDRTADRGIPSFQGAPSPAAASRFFGDPDISYVRADVDLAHLAADYRPSANLELRERLVFGRYDKFYQNVFAGGAASADAAGQPAAVPMAGYNNATQRDNLFNQADLVWTTATGAVRHTLLFGAELGRQVTDNRRNTAFFQGGATSLIVPFAAPTITGETVVFRPSATDADNHVRATVAAAYLQDQAQIGRLLVVAGLRYDSFDLALHDNRSGQDFARRDGLVSPRLGLVLKARPDLSLYASYSISYLPSAGDQFASLTASTAALEPERFENREIGAKWEARPGLTLTAAAYVLDRTNTTAPDPVTPGRLIQTGAERSKGVELGIAGRLGERWEVAGGYAWQDARIVSTTSQAQAGRHVAMTPANTFSLWNKLRLTRAWSAGLGVIAQAGAYAAVDNSVRVPGYTRLDAAVFWRISERLTAQLNLENLTDRGYIATAQGNNNILPGAPRAARVSLAARF
jgi:catecholate siderophore receptor